MAEDKKKEGIIAEFKKFALRGNVIDLAVGVIIGGAFQKIVTSVINDLIMPFVGLFTGGTNFTDKFVVLKYPTEVQEHYLTLKAAQEAGATIFAYGAFITAVIDFLIMAFIIFLLVKGINKLSEVGKKKEEPVAPTTKKCPYCLSEISIEATRCAHCTSQLESDN
jgi:large conductance mechanosensitive channel